MSENIANDYPLVKFPSEYTKQGQKALREKFLKQGFDDEQYDKDDKKDKDRDKDKEPPKPISNINLHKLMPLIKNMSQNKSMSQGELMKCMLPMLSGGNNGDMNDIVSMFIDKNMQVKDVMEEEIENSAKTKISSFKRVEQ